MKTKFALAALVAVVGLSVPTPASFAASSETVAQIGFHIGVSKTKGMKAKERVLIVATSTFIGAVVGTFALPRTPALGAFVGAL